MKYYQVGLDVEATGVKDGLYQIDINLSQLEKDERFNRFFKIFSPKSTDFWYNQDKIQDVKIPVINARLLKKANITDVMGYTQNISFLNLVYSEKYINILKKFNIGNYVAFEVGIENIIGKYYLLFVETILSKDIVFEHSIVYTGHQVLNNIEYFTFSNYDEYWEFLQKNPLARFTKISISKKYLERDIIKIQGPLPFYSERLIDFLLDCGITGLHISYNNSIQLEFV